MEQLTRFVLRRRWFVLGAWFVVLAVAMIGASRLSSLLTNRFLLPGTDTERADQILEEHFGQKTTGSFTLVVATSGNASAIVPQVEAAAERVAGELRTGKLASVQPVSPDVVSATIVSNLDPADAKGYTDAMRQAAGEIPGATIYLTGQAAVEHDLDPVFERDLQVGELFIAVPIALLLLVFTFGTLSFLLPFAFALVTIPTTLGVVFLFANAMELTTYITNFVSLIGFAVAVDYSLLIVYRFREEIRKDVSKEAAIVTTMATAGRAVVFSGTAVAIGLTLLLFMPLPFMRGFGVGGMIIPAVSVAAAVTLLPVLLSLVGKPLERVRLLPKSFLEHRADHERGFWARLAHAIMKRPKTFAIATTALLLALAVPALSLELGPGSNEGIPESLEAVQGLNVLADAVGEGALAPTTIVIDTGSAGGVSDPGVRTAVGRLKESLETDPAVASVALASAQDVDATRRYLTISVFGTEEYGKPASLDFVDRLRGEIVPDAGFPASARVYAGGGPPGGADFLDLVYSWFPWLVLGVLLATYLLLVRAFRSLLLPLKAILMNLLSILAAYGLLVLVFKHGAAERIGLISYDQIEGWIPVMIFAMLFGLSMDYEVFLVSRMREEWDKGATNEQAVVFGLTKTGRLVTAAGLVMFAAFMGFVAGSVVGLQQFGFGLAVAILIDVTIVRALLVPSVMKLLGKWNWWLPDGAARVFRVRPSPLAEHQASLRPAGK